MATIQIDQFDQALKDVMNEIQREAKRACDAAVESISKEALKAAQDAAPVHQTKSSRAGTYKKSIKRKQTRKAEFESEYTIYVAAPEYRLSHLLENGHLTKKGNRTKAIPHFAKGQELADQKLEEEFKKNFKP